MSSQFTSSHANSAASPTGSRDESASSPATDVPPLVRTDVSSPVINVTAPPMSTTTTTTTTSAAAGGALSATASLGARRLAGPPLPPLPVTSASPARLSPATTTSVTVTAVPAHGIASATSAAPTSFSTLHPITVSPAAPYVNSSASLATVSQSGGDASGLDESAGPGANTTETEPILTNGSIALAEFTSLLKPSENTNVLREHIIHLLQDVDTEDTLVRIARTLEAQEGAHSPGEVSSTTWNESSRMTPTMTNTSQSTGASVSLSTTHRRRSSAISRQDANSFEALAGFSFLHSHRRTTSVQDTPSSHQPSEDTPMCNRSTRGLGGPMEISFNSQISQHHRRSAAGGPAGLDSRRTSHRKSKDDASSSLTATHTSQFSESTAALRIDPLKREVPIIPAAVRSEGRRVAVSAAPCMPPPGMFTDAESRNEGDAGASPSAAAAAAAESAELQVPLRVIPKTPAEEQQLRRLLRRCHSFANLEADVLEDVMKAMEKEVHAAGTAILEQGQDSSEKMYLVGEGTCEAIKNGKSMGPLQPGGTFGELELMYKQAKCAATIRCVTRCVLYSLDEASYHRAVMTNSLQKRKRFENLTLNVPFLRCMPDFERMKIAEALVTREYRRGQPIIKFGSPGTYMHFVVEGEVKVVGRNNGRKVEVVRLHAGDVVGELEFLFNHLTVADVVATSHRVVTACISREHFELIIGPIQDRLKEFVATSSTYENYYLSEVADESVRSELSRIESTRKHRRVASRENAMTLEDVNPHGEVLLSAPLALLHGKIARSGDDDTGGNNTLTPTMDGLAKSTRDSVRLPKALLRFPFAQIAGKDIAVLALREDGLIVYWNAVLERLTSYSAEEVVGQNIYSFLLAEREQHCMLKAITTARNFAGDVEAFLERPSTKVNQFTLARSDGLTKATVQLTVVPPVVSAGGDAAEVVLGFGEEVKQGPQRMLEQPQWLSAQIRTILADGTMTFEERLECIAETLNNFESTYRAMTVSTERLRVVNVRQMVGHVLMDFGSEFVTRGVSVRQRFEGLPAERAYLDADLLPECLRYAMKLCLKFSPVGGGIVTIMITVTEKNGLEFLIVNFNLAGDGLPEDIAKFFETSYDAHGGSVDDDSSADGEDEDDEESSNFGSDNATPRRGLPPRLRRKLRRVQRAVEEQGGTLRIQRNPDDANIVFLIPYMPASDQDVENASVEESLHTAMESSTQSVSLSNLPNAGLMGAAVTAPAGAGLLPLDHSEDIGSVSAPVSPGEDSGLLNGSSAPNQPNFSFTTCLAEDTPAHRIMLSSFLWERRHAVLTAFKFEDVVKLFGVADILIIDLQQSVITSLHDDDPINRLREMLRHMAVIITSTSFDLVSSDTYEAAGFITLKKPCTPVQAMKAIRRAEEKSSVVKLERLRIEQTRETLARNSRGAWRRGALLGKGSFGEVYEAVDVLTGGKMAVKEMRLGANDAKIEQFVQEISTMCNLQHPNIIHYFYCEESKEQKVIRVFMEFAGGGTLQSLLKKKGKLEHAELRALLRDVVEGLAYIHSQHYVHCDIKTANVLLSAEGKGKIGDFGTAHTVHDGELLYVMQGSPLYMSPECMSAGEEDEDGTRVGYSFPSDIWSLGCVAMEMATTKPPFSHIKNMKGPAGLTNFITSLTDVPDLSPLFKCEPSVVEFVSACLNPDPSQRATAQELLQMSLFSESTHSDRASAVKALKRAQLLHVLNKFVAFQEPEEADEMERRRNRFKVRRRSSDFFSSGSSSNSSSEESEESSDGEAVSSPSSSSMSAQSKAVKAVKTEAAGAAAAVATPATAAAASAIPKATKGSGGLLGMSKSVVVGGATVDPVELSRDGDDSDWELPRRSETMARVGDTSNTNNSNNNNNHHGGSTAPNSGSGKNDSHTSTHSGDTSAAASAGNTATSAAAAAAAAAGAAMGTPFMRSLRKWHSSSSSTASSSSTSSSLCGAAGVGAQHRHTAADDDDEAHTTAPAAALLSATQAPTALPSAESAPLTHVTGAGAEERLHTPPRHRDPQARAGGKDGGAGVPSRDEDDEPEARNPNMDDAYDLSPTPKKRSKTQSRPPPPPQPPQTFPTAATTPERDAVAASKKKTKQQKKKTKGSSSPRRRISSSSSSSSRHSNSTNSNEAAFFATSSSSSDDSDGDRSSVAGESLEKVADSTMAGHAKTMRSADSDVRTAPAAAESSSAATNATKPTAAAENPANNNNKNTDAVRGGDKAVSQRRTNAATPNTAAAAPLPKSAPHATAAAHHMPTFAGRRRNVTMDDDGNIVTFQRFTSSGSASASRDSRGTGTASNRGLGGSPRLGAVAAAPLRDDASPLGHAVAGDHPNSPDTTSGVSNFHLNSPGMVTISSSGAAAAVPAPSSAAMGSAAPAIPNTSFAQPPNMSFFNYSFNKNISFMGANIDEVLSSAANDFLSSLAAPRVTSGHGHVPGSSSVFSADTQLTPLHVPERRGSTHSQAGTHSSARDGESHVDNVPIFSSPLAPDTPTTTGSGDMAAAAATAAGTGGHADSSRSGTSRSPSATRPAHTVSVDRTLSAASEHRDGLHYVGTSGHNSPLPQIPHISPLGAPQQQRHTSSNPSTGTTTGTTSTVSSPRGNSIPLVGAGASMGRRPPRARPPISNQSFFVVEDLGGPVLGNYSMATSYTPMLTANSVNSNTTASVAPVSAVTLSTLAAGAGGGVGGGGSAGGESTTSLLRHNPNIAVVAPPPLHSAFLMNSSTARDAWKNRRRFNNNSSMALGGSRAAPPGSVGSNDVSGFTPLHSERLREADPAASKGAVVSVAPVEDSLLDDGAPSSAAFGSVRSASSRRSSSARGEVPFLTAERLKEVSSRPTQRTSTLASTLISASPPATDRPGSEVHSGVLFNSLTSHEESPLFTYLKRINQTLLDVSAKLPSRRRAGSEGVSSAMLDSAVSLDQVSNSQFPTPALRPASSTVTGGVSGTAAAVAHRPPTPNHPLCSPLTTGSQLPLSAVATPTTDAGAAAAVSAFSAVGSGSSSSAGAAATAPHANTSTNNNNNTSGNSAAATVSRLGRNSLPRPVSSAAGSMATSLTKGTARNTPQLGPQMGRSNPLWPMDGSESDASSGAQASPLPMLPHSALLPVESSTTDAPPGVISAVMLNTTRNHQRGLSSSSADGSAAGVEALLQKMLQRVNTLIEQLAHVPPQPPAQPAVGAAAAAAAAASSSASSPVATVARGAS